MFVRFHRYPGTSLAARLGFESEHGHCFLAGLPFGFIYIHLVSSSESFAAPFFLLKYGTMVSGSSAYLVYRKASFVFLSVLYGQ